MDNGMRDLNGNSTDGTKKELRMADAGKKRITEKENRDSLRSQMGLGRCRES
jgi:plasmid stability protein